MRTPLASPVSPAFLLAALLALAGPGVAADLAIDPEPPEPAPAAKPPAEALADSGWTLATPRPVAECPLSSPVLPVTKGAAMLQSAPQMVPRPTLSCSGREAALPLAATIALMERTPEGLGWTVKADARTSGSWTVVRLDVPPFEPTVPVGNEPTLGSEQARAVPRAVDRPRWNSDPERRLQIAGKDPEPAPLPVSVDVAVVTHVQADGLLATDGTTWVLLDLPVDVAPGIAYRLKSGQVHGAGARLLAVPTPLRPRSQLVPFLVDPATVVAERLPVLALQGGSWRMDVVDARERDGAVEMLVVVPDSVRQPDPLPGWGALVRLESGAWRELARFPVPRLDQATLSFDADPKVVRLRTGALEGTRRILP